MSFHLAQLNVARLRAPLDDPSNAEFVAGIDLMNALADHSPGFIWRLKDDDGDATRIRPLGPETIITMSVWESLEALRDYAYKSEHLDYLRRRRDWFVPGGAAMAMWWIPAGQVPTVEEGLRRLRMAENPGPEAFTFRRPFPAPVLSRP